MFGFIRLRRSRPGAGKQACIVIAQGSWETPEPKVHVSVSSRSGTTTIDSWPDTDVGNACATLRAGSLTDILGLPVIDRRPVATNETRDHGMTRNWRAAPRDLDPRPIAAFG